MLTPFDDDYSATVRTESTTPLTPSEPDDYVVEHTSRLFAHHGEEAAPSPGLVAELTWDLIHSGMAADDGQDRYEIFDAASQDLMHLHAALYPVVDPAPSRLEPETGSAHINPNIPGDPLSDDVLYIETFTLHDRSYDEQHAAEYLLEHIIKRNCQFGIVAFIQGPDDSPAFVAAIEARGLTLISAPPRVYAVGTGFRRPPLTRTAEP